MKRTHGGQRLPALAADLVGRQVAVIAAVSGNAPAQAAKAATTTIPIVFVSGGNPVSGGVVASFNRPGGNVTGVSWIATALVPKRLQLLRQMARNPAMMGALVNRGYPEYDLQLRELEEASAARGQKINILRVATAHDVDTAFTALVQQRAGALIVANDPFFLSLRDQIVALDRYRITRSCALSFVVAFAIGYSRRQLLANTVIAASRVVLTIRIAGTVLN